MDFFFNTETIHTKDFKLTSPQAVLKHLHAYETKNNVQPHIRYPRCITL